jgi:hypothetical protein
MDANIRRISSRLTPARSDPIASISHYPCNVSIQTFSILIFRGKGWYGYREVIPADKLA